MLEINIIVQAVEDFVDFMTNVGLASTGPISEFRNLTFRLGRGTYGELESYAKSSDYGMAFKYYILSLYKVARFICD